MLSMMLLSKQSFVSLENPCRLSIFSTFLYDKRKVLASATTCGVFVRGSDHERTGCLRGLAGYIQALPRDHERRGTVSNTGSCGTPKNIPGFCVRLDGVRGSTQKGPYPVKQ